MIPVYSPEPRSGEKNEAPGVSSGYIATIDQAPNEQKKPKINEEQMKKAARKFFSAIALSLFFLGAFATAQQPKPAGRLMVHAGKLLDVRTGKTLNDQAIVIEAGKIVSVGPFAQATARR